MSGCGWSAEDVEACLTVLAQVELVSLEDWDPLAVFEGCGEVELMRQLAFAVNLLAGAKLAGAFSTDAARAAVLAKAPGSTL